MCYTSEDPATVKISEQVMGCLTFLLTVGSVLIVLLCLRVHAGAAPRQGAAHGQVDDNCRGHKKFTECNCNQFGVILSRDDKAIYDEEGMTVHKRTDLSPDSKKLYYYCVECMKCGDGVLEDHKCTQKSDTVCSNDKCSNETWVFNFVLKACQPPPTTTPSSTVRGKVTRQDTPSVTAAGPAIGSKVTEEEPKVGSSLWLQKNSQTVIIALLGGVALLIVVVVVMAMMVFRMRRQVGGLLTSGTPSSSHNSSSASIAHV